MLNFSSLFTSLVLGQLEQGLQSQMMNCIKIANIRILFFNKTLQTEDNCH